MKHGLLMLIICTGCLSAQSQILKRLKQKAEDAVTRKAENAVEKGVNKAADSLMKGKKQQEPAPAQTGTAATVETSAPVHSFKAYSKFDFVPGTEVLLSDDFSQEVIGEFPKEWNTNNRGEVVQLSSEPGQWLKLAFNSIYISPISKVFPENFTLEFDLVMNLQYKGYGYPQLDFHFHHGAVPQTEYKFNGPLHSNSNLVVKLVPGVEGNSHTVLVQTDASGNENFKSPLKRLPMIEKIYHRPMHIAFSVQGQRFRMWINEEKVYDVPKVYPVAAQLNRFALSVANSNYKDDEIGLYVTGFKLATGQPDTRNKLLTEGKFITSGITFRVNSDVVLPASIGVLQEIAKTLKENPAMNIRITGHTDSDGTKENNQLLSEKRALSVKKLLAAEFGIDESRMQTEGKGATAPVSDNKTSEGKAQNRRVEFTRL